MSAETLKKAFVPAYLNDGEQKFYRLLLFWALTKLELMNRGLYKGKLPNLEYLDYYDRFIILYRREGEENYLQVARLLRKAAHKIYRVMLKKNMTIIHPRFLNSV